MPRHVQNVFGVLGLSRRNQYVAFAKVDLSLCSCNRAKSSKVPRTFHCVSRNRHYCQTRLTIILQGYVIFEGCVPLLQHDTITVDQLCLHVHLRCCTSLCCDQLLKITDGIVLIALHPGDLSLAPNSALPDFFAETIITDDFNHVRRRILP